MTISTTHAAPKPKRRHRKKKKVKLSQKREGKDMAGAQYSQFQHFQLQDAQKHLYKQQTVSIVQKSQRKPKKKVKKVHGPGKKKHADAATTKERANVEMMQSSQNDNESVIPRETETQELPSIPRRSSEAMAILPDALKRISSPNPTTEHRNSGDSGISRSVSSLGQNSSTSLPALKRKSLAFPVLDPSTLRSTLARSSSSPNVLLQNAPVMARRDASLVSPAVRRSSLTLVRQGKQELSPLRANSSQSTTKQNYSQSTSEAGSSSSVQYDAVRRKKEAASQFQKARKYMQDNNFSKHHEALGLFQKALSFYKKTRSQKKALCHMHMGTIHFQEEDFLSASVQFSQALSSKLLRQWNYLSYCGSMLAKAYLHRQLYKKAVKAYSLAAHYYAKSGNITAQVECYETVSKQYLQQKSYARCLDVCFSISAILEHLVERESESIAESNRTSSYEDDNSSNQTVKSPPTELHSLVPTRDPSLISVLINSHRRAARSALEMCSFTTSIREAEYLLSRISARSSLSTTWVASMLEALIIIGQSHIELGNPEEGLKYFEQADTTAQREENIDALGRALLGKGRVMHLKKNFESAFVYYERALAIFKEQMQAQEEEARCILYLGQVCAEMGLTQKGIEYSERAIKFCRMLKSSGWMECFYVEACALATISKALIIQEDGKTISKVKCFNSIKFALMHLIELLLSWKKDNLTGQQFDVFPKSSSQIEILSKEGIGFRLTKILQLISSSLLDLLEITSGEENASLVLIRATLADDFYDDVEYLDVQEELLSDRVTVSQLSKLQILFAEGALEAALKKWDHHCVEQILTFTRQFKDVSSFAAYEAWFMRVIKGVLKMGHHNVEGNSDTETIII